MQSSVLCLSARSWPLLSEILARKISRTSLDVRSAFSGLIRTQIHGFQITKQSVYVYFPIDKDSICKDSKALVEEN